MTVGFHGLNINGVPKFSVVTQVHENTKWEDVIPYYIDQGR